MSQVCSKLCSKWLPRALPTRAGHQPCPAYSLLINGIVLGSPKLLGDYEKKILALQTGPSLLRA